MDALAPRERDRRRDEPAVAEEERCGRADRRACSASNRFWPRWNPPSACATAARAAWIVRISAATLKVVCRSGTRLRVDNRHCVAPPAPATIIAWSGPSSTSDMKSVKYDIDSVALPLDERKVDLRGGDQRRRAEQREEQERLVERDVREPQREDQERPADDGADVCREHAGRCAHACNRGPHAGSRRLGRGRRGTSVGGHRRGQALQRPCQRSGGRHRCEEPVDLRRARHQIPQRERRWRAWCRARGSSGCGFVRVVVGAGERTVQRNMAVSSRWKSNVQDVAVARRRSLMASAAAPVPGRLLRQR